MSNDFKKFIGVGDDPSLPIDFNSITLEEQYAKLTEREKTLVFCKLCNYTFVPPSIETLYMDEYYLGNSHFFGKNGSFIFDFWKKDAFPKIFGGPGGILTNKPYLVLSGAIGIGKSTVTRLCLAMTYARLLAMKNPSKTLGLAPKPMSGFIYHKNELTAENEFIKWFNYDLKEYSPFFRNTKNDALKFKVQCSGYRGAGAIGTDCIFLAMSEVNFLDNQEKAKEVLDTTLIRFKSRFSTDAIKKAGFYIIDSSARGNNSMTEYFLDNTDPNLTWNCKPAHYEVRANMYLESNGQTFDVFTGDLRYPPQILNKDRHEVDFDIDPEKIIHVPIQLLSVYKADLIKSLQDLSGISTGSSDSFFGGNIEHLMKCSKIKNRIPEVITVDFYNKQDRLFDKISPMIEYLPMRTTLWIGLDLSAAKGGDCTGISAVSFEGWEEIGGIKLPKMKCWFCVAIKNKEGQEISLFHIYQLLQDLHRKYTIIVSADQAFSRQILQDCDRDGIKNTGRISTDLVPCNPAIYLKNLVNNELIEIPYNKRFLREASDLYYTDKGKVDHKKRATISPEFDNPDGKEIGSKDTWDSLASACYSLKLSLDDGEEFGPNGGLSKMSKAIDRITYDSREESAKVFQSMMEDIF